MCDYSNLRQMYARQVLRVMGLDYAIDQEGSIQVERGDWFIQFPHDDETIILIGFSETVSSAYAADIAIRFSSGLVWSDFDVIIFGSRWPMDTTAAGLVKAVTIEK